MQITVAWYPVTDLREAERFYGEALGLRRTFSMPGWSEFSHAEGAAAVGLLESPQMPPPDGGATVVFRVADIHEARARLMRAGVKFDGDVEEIPNAVRLATFRDPFGNRLQLAQPLCQQ